MDVAHHSLFKPPQITDIYIPPESCRQFFSPLPKKSEGTLGLHSVRPSVRLSVRQSGKSVFRTFFVHAFRYSFDIWYIALSY
jgi:hypothetical protein